MMFNPSNAAISGRVIPPILLILRMSWLEIQSLLGVPELGGGVLDSMLQAPSRFHLRRSTMLTRAIESVGRESKRAVAVPFCSFSDLRGVSNPT
jgi:hypothetical protein